MATPGQQFSNGSEKKVCPTCGSGGTLLESPLIRLTKDLKDAALTLSDAEARYLVDSYYQLQQIRVSQSHQAKSMDRSEKKEPHLVLDWFTKNAESLERQIKRALDAYSNSSLEGRWVKSIVGIGEVIASGLLAHIDMKPWTCMRHRLDKNIESCSEKKPHDSSCGFLPLEYAGQIWSYAGIGDPTVEWKKGEKRPWNAQLKTLCWKIGQSFLKQKGKEDCLYALLLYNKWDELKIKNARGDFETAAREKLVKFNIDKKKEAYKWYSGAFAKIVVQQFLSNGVDYYEGLTRNIPTAEEIKKLKTDPNKIAEPARLRYLAKMQEAKLVLEELPDELLVGTPMLPPAHILQRACRFATKIFLSHYHCVAYEIHYGQKAALPYVIQFGGHKDYIAPPNWPMSK